MHLELLMLHMLKYAFFFFFNATNPQVNLNNTKMWCNHIINASYTRHPLLLPVGWFLICYMAAQMCDSLQLRWALQNWVHRTLSCRAAAVRVTPMGHLLQLQGQDMSMYDIISKCAAPFCRSGAWWFSSSWLPWLSLQLLGISVSEVVISCIVYIGYCIDSCQPQIPHLWFHTAWSKIQLLSLESFHAFHQWPLGHSIKLFSFPEEKQICSNPTW